MPAWLNRTAGVAGRNGTSGHTITFSTDGDAPFTPTNGRLLVVIVAGAVTHSFSGSWTEQLQPVNNAELSVATLVASSTTAVTITHNASNYPVAWVAYEFPAGTTYTAGNSATNTSQAPVANPTVTGLPGTAQTVLYAACSAVGPSNGGRDCTWSSPATEDVDSFTAYSTTDGIWLSVAYEDGVTATSATATPTLNTTGSGLNPERVTFALSVAAPAVAASLVVPRRPARGLILR